MPLLIQASFFHLFKPNSNFYLFLKPTDLFKNHLAMKNTQSFSNNQHHNHEYKPKSAFARVPLKFKAIILKSIYDKHRNKQLDCVKNAFFTWYIQKNDNQLIKDHIDRLLIAQQESKFTASRFFYRMKFLIRKQLSLKNQESHQPQQIPLQKDQEKENSQIRADNYTKKNFTQYFESLKNIFSMKLIQCENQLLSSSTVNERDEKATENEKPHRFKTEGCQLGVSVDQSFEGMYRFSTNKQEKQGQVDRKVKDVKSLGKKVALTLIKSFITNTQRKFIWQGFTQISKLSQHNKLSQQTELKKLTNLRLLKKDSSQIKIQTQTPAQTSTQHSFLQSQRSSQSSIPPINHIDNQIHHVEYSLSLLSQTIKKDNDLQDLYKQFHSQFGQFQSIQKDFAMLRVKTRNNLFDRLINVKKQLQKGLIKQAFALLNSQIKRKQTKSNTLNLSRSRVNLQTFHQIFSKPLIPLSSQPTYQQQDLRSQAQYSMTSIKMICERNNKTDTRFYKTPVRGAIKKQTFKLLNACTTDIPSNQMPSTCGSNMLKEKPTTFTENYTSSCNETIKTHVNFVLPQSPQSSQCSQNSKKSQVSIESMNDGFIKKQEKKMNNTGFYELSMKSFDSNASSSPSNKYHAQLKSQYWWNDIEEKQNLALRDGKELSKSSHSSLGNSG